MIREVPISDECTPDRILSALMRKGSVVRLIDGVWKLVEDDVTRRSLGTRAVEVLRSRGRLVERRVGGGEYVLDQQYSEITIVVTSATAHHLATTAGSSISAQTVIAEIAEGLRIRDEAVAALASLRGIYRDQRLRARSAAEA